MNGFKMELEGGELFEATVDLVREFLSSAQDRSNKVVEFKQPEELEALMDLSLGEEGSTNQEVLELCKKALHYSVHTAHPRMFNALFSGVDLVGLSGVVMTSAANTNVYTFEMAPVFSLMEKEVLRKMRELIGWTTGNGIFAPGGSISNLYGLMASRHDRFPDSKTRGCRHLPQLAVFTSTEAHYSVGKAAILLGLGTDHVVKVQCDKMGMMDTQDLEKKIREAEGEGQIPLAVVGTAGTTVLGAFDPLDKLADICQEHNIWFHVDASYGGSCLVSKSHKFLCKGIERADSVTWNPHKALHVPLQCSAFLTRHDDTLKNMLSLQASYLFQKDKLLYDVSFDTGDMSIQCGRTNDAFKIWLMWKKSGLAAAEREIDRQVGLATYLRERIRERAGFKLVVEEQQYTNVCFWYIPPCLREVGESEQRERLHEVAPRLKAAMVEAGTMMISYQPLGDLPNFLRMVTVSPSATEADMEFVLDELERIGADILL